MSSVFHLGIADFDTLFVGGGVERAFDLQAGLGGGRRGNQLDHGHAIDEGAPTPGLRDVAERELLDLIPPRSARRIMMDIVCALKRMETGRRNEFFVECRKRANSFAGLFAGRSNPLVRIESLCADPRYMLDAETLQRRSLCRTFSNFSSFC
jgi:hypothetical protein